jgi:hypothetical protein
VNSLVLTILTKIAFFAARAFCKICGFVEESLNGGSGSLRVGPDAGRFAVAEEFQMDDVGVAADGAVFDILLLGAGGGVQRDNDLLAAGGADV